MKTARRRVHPFARSSSNFSVSIRFLRASFSNDSILAYNVGTKECVFEGFWLFPLVLEDVLV
jgi:hypothetical protein